MQALKAKNNWADRLSPDRFGFWIVTALLLKLIYVSVFFNAIDFGYQSMGWARLGLLGYASGDTPGYLEPIDHWLRDGTYYPDYRMPGYGAIYLFIRLLLSKAVTMNSIVCLQFFTAVVSVWCLAQSAYRITKDNIFFYLTFFIYALSMRSVFWDFGYVTESFTTSFLIFSTFFFVRFFETQRTVDCLLSGFFLTWAIFLRPVYLPLYFILVFLICFQARRTWKSEWKKIFAWTFLLCLPFMICDGLWIIRNYSKYKLVLPLTKSYYAPEFEDSYLSSLMNFVIASGGDRSYWNPRGEIRWYLPDLPNLPPNLADEPPSYIYTSAFNRDTLLAIKQDLILIENPSTPKLAAKALNLSVKGRLAFFTTSIREEKPSLFYFKSRIGFLRRFLFHSGTDFLPPLRFFDMSLSQQFLKLSNTASYLFSVVLGLAGSLYIILKFRVRLFIFSFAGVFSIMIYPLLGQLEPRYFVPAFPFMLVCAAYLLTVIMHKLNTLLLER